VSSFGTQDSFIGLATSTDLETWADAGSVGVASDDTSAYNAIDGNLFQTGDGALLTFGSFWQDIFQVAMSADGTAPSGDSYGVAYDPNGEHAVEGAFLYEYDGAYYLFYSNGICCGYDSSMPAAGEEYKIKVCRSDSPTGPFVSFSNILGS
jgi:arabinan endo-1,5-alpha-L-arabinosidase